MTPPASPVRSVVLALAGLACATAAQAQFQDRTIYEAQAIGDDTMTAMLGELQRARGK